MGIRKKVLLRDIIIKKGTIFEEIPEGSEKIYTDNNHFEATIELTKNTYGSITYSFDDNVKGKEKGKLNSFFEDVEG